LQGCERLLALEARLPAVLQGQDKSANAAEHLQFAELCTLKKRYSDAARFYADAFTAQPKLADDLQAGHRYNAACYAALAATRQGAELPRLTRRSVSASVGRRWTGSVPT
jgi:hypothetical protein